MRGIPVVPQDAQSVLLPRNLLPVMATVVIWACTFPLITLALRDLPPLTLAAFRFALACPMFLAVLAWTQGGFGSLRRLTRRQWGLITIWALLSTTISNITQNIGMQWTSASVSSVLQSSGPVLGMFLAILFLGERYTHFKLLGGVLATVGTVGIALDIEGGFQGSTVVGNVLVLGSELSYILAGVVGKYLLREVDPVTLMAAAFPIATAPLAAGALLESPAAAVAAASAGTWGIVIFMATLPTTVAMLLWYVVLDRVEYSHIIYFIYLIPVVAIVASWALLGEVLTPLQALFTALVISGVLSAQRRGRGGMAVVGTAGAPARPG